MENNVGYYEFEYKADVRDKVKRIESLLSATGSSFENDGHEQQKETHTMKSSVEQNQPTKGSDVRRVSVAPVTVSTEQATSFPVTQTLASNATSSSSKNSESEQKLPTTKRQPQHSHRNDHRHAVTLNDTMEDHTSRISSPIPRKPRPEEKTLREHCQTEEVEKEFSISSGAGSRRSSEDDGIADMTSESDAFDDAALPLTLPKIRENAFFLQDRRRSKEESENEDLNFPVPVITPRRASHSPQGVVEDVNALPKTQRTRTDSTNSAENYVVRQFSADKDPGRRESQAEVKIDVLHSKGPPASPARSPVIVRSERISNSAASILVLGLPLSGKSATIDSLVQKPTGNTGVPSVTPEIVEFTAKIKILDSTNLFNLKIIETPGYSNDPTIDSDAQLMATLVSYLESKEGLRGKPPTIVLVVMRFDDKRLWNPEDEHPDIVNFLKLIHNFQQHLSDTKHSNFVFVLTHFLSGDSSEQDLRRPQGKIVELINLIQKYTSIPHPITVICGENQAKKNEKGVPLPNGEMYPYNLIEKIKMLLTKKGRDSVGETVLRTAFGIEYPYSIKECQITKRIALEAASHLSVQQMLKRILHSYMDIERTEIFTLLEIGWENIPLRIRKKFPESLFTVQQIFQTKKICHFEDIPEDPTEVLSLVRQMPSNLAVKDLLTETLQLKVPACYPALYIGQGYDLSKDTTTNVSPFMFSNGLKTSPVGLIPNEYECKIRDDREICFKFFSSVEDYVSERLKDMNLRYSISPNSLSALSTAAAATASSNSHRWGYNMVKKNQEPSKSTIATAAIEYRVFQMTLHQQPELELKPEFWDAVQKVPDLDIKDPTSVSTWKEFFGYWGTHVVKSAFGGGSVEITLKGSILSKVFNSMKKDFILSSDEYETSRVFQWVTGDGLDFVASCGKEIKNDFLQGYDVEAHFHGGDIKFQQIDLTKLESKEAVADVREEWKDSLVANPTMLETSLVLVPLSYYVRQKSEGIATKIDIALHYFYSDFMVSQGKQSSCAIL